MAKIIFDARLYGLEHTGVGRYIMRLLEGLSKIDKKNSYALLLRKKYFNELKLPKAWKRVLTDFRHYTLEEQLRLPGIINKQKPDLVHFPHLNVPVFWSGKFVVTLHDMTMHKQGTSATTLPLPLYYLKRIPYKLIFRRAVKSSQTIITPSDSVKKELAEYFDIEKDKVKTIYMGLDDEFFEARNNGKVLEKYGLKGDYFVYTGNIYPHKNIRRAIEAVVALNKVGKKKIHFAIASSRNIFLKRLQRTTRELDADDYVKFLGFVPDKDLKLLYKKSLAFVYPSLSEGFGLQGLEAIASGTLVLASDIPVFKEVYKDNVAYFNPYDFSSIAKAMKDALEMNKGKKEKIVQSGQSFIRRYSWQKTAKETLNVYQEVLRKV